MSPRTDPDLLSPEGVLRRAVNGAMASPPHDHAGHGVDYSGCSCDGTVGDHYSGHILTRINEAGYVLVPATPYGLKVLRRAVPALP